MTNKPEDDPQTVAQLAASLLGNGSAKDHQAAVRKAITLLKEARSLIDQENDPKRVEYENLCAKGERYSEVLTDGNGGVALWVDYRFPEPIFIDELVKGVSRAQRPDRRKEFATRWWAALRRVRPEAPDIANRQTWTLSTLKSWKEAFDNICRNGRAEVNRANRQPRRRRRSRKKS